MHMTRKHGSDDRADEIGEQERPAIDAAVVDARSRPAFQIQLPPLPPGCSAVISPGPQGSIRIDVAPARLAFTLEEACERLPNKPHPDTLRAQLERAGVRIGTCGRTPLVSEEQLRRALGLAI
jgi:hypothetical protein